MENADEQELKKQETVSEIPEDEISLHELSEEIKTLRALVEKKLFVEGYKDNLINSMSDELRTYKDGMYEKILKPVLVDVIEIVNDLHRMIRTYSNKNEETVDRNKFVSILSIYESDLEEILEKYDVNIVMVEGNEFDARKQKVVKVIDTEDEGLHRMIAERLLKGFELNGKMIAPEKVNVYRYTEKEADAGVLEAETVCGTEEKGEADKDRENKL